MIETQPLIDNRQYEKDLKIYKIYRFLIILSSIILILIFIYNVLVSTDVFIKTSYENSCECFNTTGWNLVNSTTCCLDAMPSYCRNSTLITNKYKDPPIPIDLYFSFSFSILIVIFYTLAIFLEYSKKVHDYTKSVLVYNIVFYTTFLPLILNFIYTFVLFRFYNESTLNC